MTVAASALSAAQCDAAGPICIVLEAIHHLEGVYPGPRTPTAPEPTTTADGANRPSEATTSERLRAFRSPSASLSVSRYPRINCER